MKIVTYRELERKDEFLPLMDQAFRWSFNPKFFEKLVKVDPRSENSPIGFCALENNRVVSFVGVWHLATRTLKRTTEYVGGIYGVATLPDYGRKGICSSLMDVAHRYFKEKNYRFSFLSTMPTLIAYDFYRKIGYLDVTEFPSAYKIVIPQKTSFPKKEKKRKFDLGKILEIYNEFVKDKTGFVVRDRKYLKMLQMSEGITARGCLVEENGYVMFRKVKGALQVRELMALDEKERNRLISLMENKAKTAIYDRAVMDKSLLQTYKSRGYMLLDKSYGVVMMKPLGRDSFKETYGDRFHISGLDVGC